MSRRAQPAVLLDPNAEVSTKDPRELRSVPSSMICELPPIKLNAVACQFHNFVEFGHPVAPCAQPEIARIILLRRLSSGHRLIAFCGLPTSTERMPIAPSRSRCKPHSIIRETNRRLLRRSLQEAHMSNMYDKVTGQMDPLTKLISIVPGFSGYVQRENRRAADKLMREALAVRFEELWKRISNLQTDLVSAGKLEAVGGMEKAGIQVRTFVDKIRMAPRGYSGLFDAVKINEKELEQLYSFDLAFFDTATALNNALDNVEAEPWRRCGPASGNPEHHHLARQAVETFNRRAEVFSGAGK